MNHPACMRVGVSFVCAAAILAVAHAPAAVPTNARQPLGPRDIAPPPEHQAAGGGRSGYRVIGGRRYRVRQPGSFAFSGPFSHPPALLIPRDTPTWFASHLGRVGTMPPAATGSPVSELASERALNAATGHGDFASGVTVAMRWWASEVHGKEYMGLPLSGYSGPLPGLNVLYVPQQAPRAVIVVRRPKAAQSAEQQENAPAAQPAAAPQALPTSQPADVDPDSLVFMSSAP